MSKKTIKIWDTCFIRSDLSESTLYMWQSIGKAMRWFSWEEVIITKILPTWDLFKINKDKWNNLWNIEMLDLKRKKPKRKKIKKVKVIYVTRKQLEEKFWWPVELLD